MSEQFTLSTADRAKWLQNQTEFLKPLVLAIAGFYFLPLLATLGDPENVLELSDFYPSTWVVSSIVLYLVNACWDLIRKWASTNK